MIDDSDDPFGEDAQDDTRDSMEESELVALIEARTADAIPGAEVDEERSKALSYYFGEPFGVEEPNHSQIVMREVYSVIEWIMPALMKMFFGGKRVVRFTPLGPQDIAQADQETDYINHVILDKNTGFTTVASWFKDALLSKTAYVVAYWESKQDTTDSRYTGLDDQSLQMLLSDPTTQIVGQEVDENGTLAITVRTTKDYGCVRIRGIPAERVRVARNHADVSLREATFVRYWERMTVSALREMGFDVEDDIADEADPQADSVEFTRRSDTPYTPGGEDDNDPASREITVETVFLRVDYDGDGIAELRRVVKVGSTLLVNEPYDHVPVAALTPTLVPHRHIGMSYAEVVQDVQEIKSMLLRGVLDNIAYINENRWFLDVDRVDFDDFLNPRPNGAVRVEGGVANAAMPMTPVALGGNVLQTIEYMDNVLENRTGASPRVLQGQSFDGNAINRTATGINTIMSAAMSRIEMIARTYAETGMVDLMRIVHALTLKHGRQEQMVRLRGQWVAVDPSTWDKRDAMTVEVGLGTGDSQQMIQMLQMILTAQQNLLATGLSDPQKMYNALSRLAIEAGFKDPDEFWNNPAERPDIAQRVNQPPPEVMLKQAEMQQKEKIETMQVQARMRDIDARQQIEQAKIAAAQEENFLKAISTMASTSMVEDNKLRLAGHDVQDAPAPKRKFLNHVRDQSGRIVRSEIVEE